MQWHRARVDPRHQGGEGVAGDAGSVLPPKLDACFVGAYGETHTSYTLVRTTITTRRFHSNVAILRSLLRTPAVAMSGERDVGGVVSARRRRERRLRSCWRRSSRRSSQWPWTTVVVWGQRLCTKPHGNRTLRAQVRPGGLEEPAALVETAVTVGYVATAVPSLAPPVLAAPAADGVALSFLLA